MRSKVAGIFIKALRLHKEGHHVLQCYNATIN